MGVTLNLLTAIQGHIVNGCFLSFFIDCLVPLLAMHRGDAGIGTEEKKQQTQQLLCH